jgi:predicted DNA-binding protein (MmcQ/YjbR family)
MDIQQLYEFCLSKKSVTEHFPFDQDTLVFKVGGKIFCLASLHDWENGNPSVLVKCDPNYAEVLRAQFESVTPGYHSNKKHWNTVLVNKEVTDRKILHFINHSYELVFKSLTKKSQNEILKNEI